MVLPTHTLLRAYIRSGWAFLIPYLVVYLLYAWLGWPVNSSSVESATGHQGMAFVSLFRIYWALHLIHCTLCIMALHGSWKETTLARPATETPRAALGTTHRLVSSIRAFGSAASPIVPWLLLALLFWIPGIPLEWPSDPWEHLRRINEWHADDFVTAHSAWKKSSYFLSYSLTAHSTGLAELSWLEVYHTAACLLLCWQYYRLARTVGLGARAGMLFVLLQALLLGNNIFSFYRYYGLSSSILAQVGAVALTRLTMETLLPRQANATSANYVTGARAPKLTPSLSALARLLIALPPLILLIFFNHIQALGIAGLGILAVTVWRLIEWKRAMIVWLAAAAVLASIATVRWFPQHPVLHASYRSQGWLNAWYGFNLLSHGSPAFLRAFQILGGLGVLNLAIGLWIIVRKNHVAGWLTFMPILAMILPCFALPIAHILASRNGDDDIISFNRLLFALPVGLALVVGLSRSCSGHMPGTRATTTYPELPTRDYPRPAILLPAALFLALALVPIQSGYNRFWHSLQVPPDDLQLKPLLALWTSSHLSLAESEDTQTFTVPLAARVRETFSPHARWDIYRQINRQQNAADFEQRLDELGSLPVTNRFLAGAALPDLVIRSLPSQAARNIQLIAHPTADGSHWVALGGDNFESTATSANSVVISNQTGHSTHVFNTDVIPVDHNQRYQLTSTLRQSGTTTATNYLAVAWYDKSGNHLASAQPAPAGGDSPRGWSNGTYSYYGLNNQPARPAWTTYSITFGRGEFATIPPNAAYLRLGALLNCNTDDAAKIEIRDVALWQKPGYSRLLFALPNPLNLSSTGSFAAWLSNHWSPQRVAEDHAGLVELRAAASQTLTRDTGQPGP